ncbi:MAG: RDD family protein [Acidimicrobiia bacterium]
MQLDDQLKIRTPEGVELSLTLAGLGSRIVATMLDAVIQFVIAVIFIIAAALLPGEMGDLGFGLVALFLFLLFFGYPILFEVLDGGRSIGKRATGLRVVSLDGGAVGFASAAIRNVLRLVDLLPGGYAVGAIAIVANSKNQRLGDMAAGTVVIRERTTTSPVIVAPLPPGAVRYDVTRISQEDVALIRRYFERRDALSPARRQELANTIVQRVAVKVALAEPAANPEELLATILHQKAGG